MTPTHSTSAPTSALARVFVAFAKLPLGAAQFIGACLGGLMGVLPTRYGRRLAQNAALAGYSGLAFRLRAGAHAGMMAAELPFLWCESGPRSAVARVKVPDWGLVDAARSRSAGILFLTPHLGCFEVTAQAFAPHAPITVLYRAPKREDFRQLVEHYRTRPQLLTASATLSGVRALIRALKQGQAVGLLPDQVPQAGEGVPAPFFGRDALTMVLPAKLAQASGATVLFAVGKRLPFGRGYELSFSPLDVELSSDAAQAAAQINRALEALIRQTPTQYLWGYNRYKRSTK